MKKRSISEIMQDMENDLSSCEAISDNTELKGAAEYAADQCAMFHLVLRYLPSIKAEKAVAMVDPFITCCTTQARLIKRIYNILDCYRRLQFMVSDLNRAIAKYKHEDVTTEYGDSAEPVYVKAPYCKELVLDLDKFLRDMVTAYEADYDECQRQIAKDEGKEA